MDDFLSQLFLSWYAIVYLGNFTINSWKSMFLVEPTCQLQAWHKNDQIVLSCRFVEGSEHHVYPDLNLAQ